MIQAIAVGTIFLTLWDIALNNASLNGGDGKPVVANRVSSASVLLPDDRADGPLQIFIGIAVLLVTALVVTRISLALFFLSFIPKSKRLYRAFIWFSMMSLVLTAGAYIPLMVVSSVNVKSLNNSQQLYTVTSVFAVGVFCSFSLIIGDFVLSVLGSITVWEVELPRIIRLSACALIGLGSLGGIVSIIRLVINLKLHVQTGSGFVDTLHLAQWSLVEMGVGIMVANLALTRPFWARVCKNIGIRSSWGTENQTHTNALRTGAKTPSRHPYQRPSLEISKTQIMSVTREMETDSNNRNSLSHFHN